MSWKSVKKKHFSLVLLATVWSALLVGQVLLDKNKLDEEAIRDISGTSFGAACQRHGPQKSILVQVQYNGDSEVVTELIWLSDHLDCDESIIERFPDAEITKTYSNNYTLGFTVDGFDILKPEDTIPLFRDIKSISNLIFAIAIIFSIAILAWGFHTKSRNR